MNDSDEEAREIQNEIDKWTATFPPALAIRDPTTTWDKEHPSLVNQRSQLHTMVYMIKLNPLKSYLTRTSTSTNLQDELRAMGVEAALKLLEQTHHLFDLLFPTGIKYFLMTWCFFDSACILCSALIHDQQSQTLPRRSDILEAIYFALERLGQSESISKTAATSYKILSKLVTHVQTLPLSATSSDLPTKRKCKASSSLSPKSQVQSRLTPNEHSASATGPPSITSDSTATGTDVPTTTSANNYPTPPNSQAILPSSQNQTKYPNPDPNPIADLAITHRNLFLPPSYNELNSYMNPHLDFTSDLNFNTLFQNDESNLGLDLESSGLGDVWTYETLNLDGDMGLGLGFDTDGMEGPDGSSVGRGIIGGDGM